MNILKLLFWTWNRMGATLITPEKLKGAISYMCYIDATSTI